MTTLHKLTAAKVAALIKGGTQGRHGDGGGLYLQIDGGSAAWVFRYIRHGRERQAGLGPARDVTLAEARDKATAHRKTLAQDDDPQMASVRAKAPTVTFAEATAQFLVLYRQGLRNEKHKVQWGGTIEKYAYPKLGALPVKDITFNHVLAVLEPVWFKKPDLGSRLRGRIEKVLSFSKVKQWRSGENPAAWKDNLEHALPAVGKIHTVRHHPAMDHRELPAFIAELRTRSGVAVRALEFLILNVARTADVIGVPRREDKPPLRWCDVDLDERVWTIPRSKTSSLPHKKPLSARSMEILAEMRHYRLDDTIIFPSLERPGQALSTSAVRNALRRMMERSDLSVHGFRATFKTWAGEDSPFPIEIIESSLAHGVISNKVEAAYRRADFFEKRRKLMEAWSEFASSGGERTGGVVIPMRSSESESTQRVRRR
jgi:integrase